MPFTYNPTTGLLDYYSNIAVPFPHPTLTDMPDLLGVNPDHDARYYTQAQVLALLTALTHVGLLDMPSAVNADHDGRYYTEAEVLALIAAITHAGLPDMGPANADHDGRYYTEAEDDAIMAAHIAIAAAHHARYTDAETDARIAIHAAIVAAHHARYVDAEAVAAMGIIGDGNPLHHNRYADADVLLVAAALVHAARHQNGGADEISVAGLSGLLADDQHVIDAEVDARIALHAAIAAAHHAKTVDDEVYGLTRAGLDAAKPAPAIAGRFYWATDTLILYRDTGAAWVEMARGETVIRLAQLAERNHGSLAGVGAGDHHAQFENVVEDATPQLGGALDVNEKAIQDGDGDTKIQLEEGADDDHIRMDVGGTGGDNAFLLHDTGILSIPKQAAARADRITSTFSVPHATVTNLDANSEIYDIQGEYNLGTDVYTCTEPGLYLIEACALFLALGNGKNCIVGVEHNGATVGNGQKLNATGGAANIGVFFSMPVTCAATDTLEVFLYHNHGAARNIHFGGVYTHASFSKIT